MFSRHPCFVFSYAASSPLTLLDRTVPLIGRRGFSYIVSAECTLNIDTNTTRNIEDIPNVKFVTGDARSLHRLNQPKCRHRFCQLKQLHIKCTRVQMLASRIHLCESSLIACQHTCEKVSIPNFQGSKCQPVGCVVVVNLQPKRRKRESLCVLAIQRDFPNRFT